MASLVKQLQKSAIDNNIKCSELLTMAYYTAVKINDTELANFCKNEIEGYKDATLVPEYRKIEVDYKTKQPYRGWIPLQIPCNNKNLSWLLHIPIRESVSELENLYNSSSDGYLGLQIPSELQSALNQLSDIPFKEIMEWPISAFFSKEKITKICNYIRESILKKSIELESKGILGDDDMFDESKKGIGDVHISIAGDATGANIGAFMNNQNIKASVDNTTMSFDFDKAETIAKQISKQYKRSSISRKEYKKIKRDLKEIKKNIKDKNESLVKSYFTDLKSIFINVTSDVIAAGILALIATLF